MWNGLSWLRIWFMIGISDTGDEPLDSVKISWICQLLNEDLIPWSYLDEQYEIWFSMSCNILHSFEVYTFHFHTSLMRAATRRAVSGVCSAGFKTTVHPAASAGPSFQTTIAVGKFQGMICPTTPTGSKRVNENSAPSGSSNDKPMLKLQKNGKERSLGNVKCRNNQWTCEIS